MVYLLEIDGRLVRCRDAHQANSLAYLVRAFTHRKSDDSLPDGQTSDDRHGGNAGGDKAGTSEF
ncbi:hypothetical protein [Gemmatimonas sp.]|jgi:hypothetical protein|uniref:hypothetical protein n=1 Tax=Gemmatimonas sp. TaxID=1962908 RepID=UPI0037C021EE